MLVCFLLTLSTQVQTETNALEVGTEQPPCEGHARKSWSLLPARTSRSFSASPIQLCVSMLLSGHLMRDLKEASYRPGEDVDLDPHYLRPEPGSLTDA